MIFFDHPSTLSSNTNISHLEVYQVENDDTMIMSCQFHIAHADLVSMNSRAHHGSASIDLIDPATPFECAHGTAPTTVSIECGGNGILETQTTGQTVTIAAGERTVIFGETLNTTADCTLELDGVAYESANGQIMRQMERTTP